MSLFQASFIVQDSLVISRLRGVQIMVIFMAVEKLVFRRSPDSWFFDIIFDDFNSALCDTRFPRVLKGERFPNFIHFGQEIVGFLETLQNATFETAFRRLSLSPL